MQIPAQPLVRVPNTTVNLPTQTPTQGYHLVDALNGLRFSYPVALASPPGETNRLFVVEREGKIIVIPDLTHPTREVFLDLSTNTFSAYSEAGLLGLAFHPGYATNGLFYVYRVRYNIEGNDPSQLKDQLSCFRRDPNNPNRALADSEIEILSQIDLSNEHNAGEVHFGPDGYLYLSIGDMQPLNSSPAPSQEINGGWFGCILRIDVDKRPDSLPPNPLTGATTNYAIPPNNPFIGRTEYRGATIDPATVRTEIFALGFRNPWRFAFDRVSGQLAVGDVGSAIWEEINIVEAGGNYGWPYVEGVGELSGWTDPVMAYQRGFSPTNGNCVIGGVYYGGSQINALVGKYVFGDFVSGNIWALTRSGNTLTNRVWIAGDNEGISCFGQDPRDGEVLLATYWTGTIKKLVYSAPTEATPLPTKLSDTGIFAALSNLTVAAGIVPYEINHPFWSDRAQKSRWFSVPKLANTIGFEPQNNWSFSTGTFWVKHFELELTNGVANSRRRLETRVLMRSQDGIYGLTYKWDAAGTNAFLVPPDGADEVLPIFADGEFRTQVWHYPSRYECLVCHNQKAGYALGFNTAQLNRNPPANYMGTNQIASLSAAGYFSAPITNQATLPAFGTITDEAVPILHRARSYLSVNCVHCHQPGSPVALEEYNGWDAQLTTHFKDAKLMDNYIIRAQDPQSSRLLQRFIADTSFRMPPLASSVIDTNGYDLLTRWVETMVRPPWTNLDVGSTLFDGWSAEEGSGFRVSSAGGELTTNEDSFQFLYQIFTGDGQIIARLNSFDGVTPGASAGLMFRAALTPNAAYAFVGRSDALSFLKARANTNTATQATIVAGTPEWLRLVRNQNQITGYTSINGSNWTRLATATAAVSGDTYVGLAVTGGNSSRFANASFDSISLLSINWINPPVDSVLNLPADLSLAVEVTTQGTQVSKVEFYVDGTLIGASLEAPYTVTWTNATVGLHQIVAKAVDVMGNQIESAPRLVTGQSPVITVGFRGVNTSLHGNWTNQFGALGYMIAGNATSLPPAVAMTLPNATTVIWANPASSPAALWKAQSNQRIAASWTAVPKLNLDVNQRDGIRREVALYFLDWTPTNAHVLNVAIRNAQTGALLDQRTVSNFALGKYLTWSLNGPVRFEITSGDGGWPVLSGVFLNPNSNLGTEIAISSYTVDAAPANLAVSVDANNPMFPVKQVELLIDGTVVGVDTTSPYTFVASNLWVGDHELIARATDASDDLTFSAPVTIQVGYPQAQATFYRTDTLTMGAWPGIWGNSGYVIFGSDTNLSASVNFAIAPGRIYSWVYINRLLSFAPWALSKPDDLFGIEAEWNDPETFTLNLDFPDGREHLTGFYLSDFGGLYRQSRVDIFDATNGTVLDSQVLSNFPTGNYYFWQLRGRVQAQFTRLAGGNVGLGAVFFDPERPPLEFWRARQFSELQLADPTISGDLNDPDGDGWSNLAEFALGGNPWAKDHLPVEIWDDRLTLSYSRVPAASNFLFTTEYSTNLLDWLSGSLWLEILKDDSETGDVTVQSVKTIHQTPQGYLRLRIQSP